MELETLNLGQFVMLQIVAMCLGEKSIEITKIVLLFLSSPFPHDQHNTLDHVMMGVCLKRESHGFVFVFISSVQSDCVLPLKNLVRHDRRCVVNPINAIDGVEFYILHRMITGGYKSHTCHSRQKRVTKPLRII